MKSLVFLVGLIALALGVVWACEGMGYFHYALPYMPAMFGVRLWAYYGTGVALLGLLLIIYSRRS